MWSLKIEFKVITPGRRFAQITVEAARINDDVAKQATEAPGKISVEGDGCCRNHRVMKGNGGRSARRLCRLSEGLL
jgi:hypothetical protein